MAGCVLLRSVRTGLAVVVGMIVIGGGEVWGQWEQTHKLTADDAAEEDSFGHSVSISGKTIVIGAFLDDEGGYGSGSAYVFDAITGEQLHKLTADDAAEYNWFGLSVSVSGNIIVIGAYGDDDGAGSAYVFDATIGEQIHKLTADDSAAEDQFGRAVAVNGNTIVVGAWYDDDAGSASGSAYVFNTSNGAQLHKVTAADAAVDDEFGRPVSISGNTIVVGAKKNDDAGSDSGSAYVFDAITGEQLHKLTADDATTEDNFGRSVSVSGNTIVVGAYGDDDAEGESGSAYIFDATTGQQLRKLTADDAAGGDFFGFSVSVHGHLIVVGAPYDSDAGYASGSAYVFDTATGEQLHKFTADDAAFHDQFGFSVSVSGNIIVVGADGDDDAGNNSGSAYVFQQPAPCSADIYEDGMVDVLDLMVVLAKWGTADPAADITGPYGMPDGVVDVLDLVMVLAAWGPCF